jgi:hypothetical protein
MTACASPPPSGAGPHEDEAGYLRQPPGVRSEEALGERASGDHQQARADEKPGRPGVQDTADRDGDDERRRAARHHDQPGLDGAQPEDRLQPQGLIGHRGPGGGREQRAGEQQPGERAVAQQ